MDREGERMIRPEVREMVRRTYSPAPLTADQLGIVRKAIGPLDGRRKEMKAA